MGDQAPATPTTPKDQGEIAELAASFKDVGSSTMAVTSELVKGIGHRLGKSRPEENPEVLAPLVMRAEKSLRASVAKSYSAPDEIIKGLSPDFQQSFGRLLSSGSPMHAGLDQLVGKLNQALAELGKDITLTSPLSTGFVPFDLVAPAKLIYPVFSPLRNMIPRVPGQGTSRRAKLITGISGSQTGGSNGNAVQMAIGELNGGALTSWPISLPASTSEGSADLSVSYRFFGLTEPISWLAQFAGQGFQDISALANLILLQKFILNEEYNILGGNRTALAQPAAPTLALRTAGTGETAITGLTTNLYVVVTATNFYGETAYAVGNVATNAPSTQVCDVTIAPQAGYQQYNVYVATGASNPGRTGFFPQVSGLGGTKFTIQGALATTGANPPASDSGTSSSNTYDGLISILTGNASGTYTVGAGYNTQNVGKKLSVSVINTMLYAMWKATKADPSHLIGEGSDIGRLSDDIRINAATQGYRMFIAQSEMAGVLAGAAVSEVVNPVTRRALSVMVHPWLTQGTAMALSFQLPFPWSETPNCWENVLVQDYLSIAWPVIDMSFRYSMFMYGALVGYAPIYSGILQGLQISDTTPYS